MLSFQSLSCPISGYSHAHLRGTCEALTLLAAPQLAEAQNQMKSHPTGWLFCLASDMDAGIIFRGKQLYMASLYIFSLVLQKRGHIFQCVFHFRL